jgi:hypothetical protein
MYNYRRHCKVLYQLLYFLEKISHQLQECGFTINPYDSCVSNKMINYQQCTIIWQVDNLKISQVKPSVVFDTIRKLEEVFGQEAPLKITRGKYHEYLGMYLDFSRKES